MPLTELNKPSHPWYQKRNHVRIPRLAESKKYLDPAYLEAGGGLSVSPVAVTKDCSGNVTFTGGYYRPTVTIAKNCAGSAAFTIGA